MYTYTLNDDESHYLAWDGGSVHKPMKVASGRSLG
jgi:hypothetical protein